MLTENHARLIAELARAGLQSASAKTPPAAMRAAWEAVDAYEAWIEAQVRAAAEAPRPKPTPRSPPIPKARRAERK